MSFEPAVEALRLPEFARLAHDLTQPLAAITNYLGAARLVKAGADGTDREVGRLIELAIAEALRAGALARALQAAARSPLDVQAGPSVD